MKGNNWQEVKKIAQRICEKDGLKQEANFGQMLEIVNAISVEIVDNPESIIELIVNGLRIKEEQHGT